MTRRASWGFGFVTEKQLREADLFYAELLGLPAPRRRTSRSARVQAEAGPPSDPPFNPRDPKFPARPGNAPGGRAFMRTIAGRRHPASNAAWVARENAMVDQLLAGNMPDSLLRWVRINLEQTTPGGRKLTGWIEVLPDYLAIGSDRDFVHVPLDPLSAQRVAAGLACILPTARLCHQIYLATRASNRIGAIVRPYSVPDSQRPQKYRGFAQTSSDAYLEHSEAIQEKMRSEGIRLGELVAGHKKDVVIAQRLHQTPNKIAFHGFYDSAGYPMEPCYENPTRRPQPGCVKDVPVLAHERRFSDYSQGVRLVNPMMFAEGQARQVHKLLEDPELSYLLSSEGPITPATIPPAKGRKFDDRWNESLPIELVSNPSSVRIEAGQPLGSKRTTVPIAVVSPQRQMNEILDRELSLFAKARAFIEWLEPRSSSTVSFEQAFGDSALLGTLDRSRDAALEKRLRPFANQAIPARRGQLFTTDAELTRLLGPPTSAHELWPIVDVLAHYGVVRLQPSRSNPFGTPGIVANVSNGKLDRARFDSQTAAVEKFAVGLKGRIANSPKPHHVVGFETAPNAWTNPAAPQTHRTFATLLVKLLARLRARNDKWKVGTYPNHWWNDFSADIFIISGRTRQGFYEQAAVRKFFEDLNAAGEESSAPGKFAWKAIYNDESLARETNGLYGDGRVLFGVAGHGPGDDMHIHLDLRPLTVPFDAVTGFWLDGQRVVLSPPPSRPEAPLPPPLPAGL